MNKTFTYWLKGSMMFIYNSNERRLVNVFIKVNKYYYFYCFSFTISEVDLNRYILF